MERHRSNLHANEKENVVKNDPGDKKEDEDSDKNKRNGKGKGNDEDEDEKRNGENSTDEDVWTPLDVATDFYNRIIIDLSCKPAKEKKPEKQEKRKSTNWWENLEF